MATARTQPTSQPPAVVLIDDEARFLQVIARLLSLDGEVQVVGTAMSCEQALMLLRASAAPDLVVVDVQMPGHDGFQTVRALLEARPALKVVLTSDAPEDAYPELSVEVGAVGFLPKRDLCSETLLRFVSSPAAATH